MNSILFQYFIAIYTLPQELKSIFNHISGLVTIDDDDADAERPADIYAIGFEEMVDLNASNIIAAR